MTIIVLKKEINFGVVFLDWLAKWIEDSEMKKVAGKQIPKMFYGRFISIILKKRLKNRIEDEEEETLNCNKRITSRLFENWKKNLG